MKLEELGLELDTRVTKLKINDDIELDVRRYLPVAEKTQMLQYIINAALDDRTGCFSPLRIEIYYSLAICKWYAGIEFDPESDPGQNYDLLESNGIVDWVISRIPEDEAKFITRLVEETTADIARYNSSAAGIIQNMSVDADGLNNQITDILSKIQAGEGLETLAAIKDVVGTD